MTYDGIFKTVRWIKDVETPEGARILLTKYFYDHQGRLLTVDETDSEGANTELKLRTRYLYDEGGRLVRVNQGGGTQVRTFAYDAAGLLTDPTPPPTGSRARSRMTPPETSPPSPDGTPSAIPPPPPPGTMTTTPST